MSAFRQDNEFRTEVFKMAAYYREKVDDFVLDMYAEEFAEAGLTLQQIRYGYLQLRKNPRVTRLPLPSAVIQAVRPELDPMEEAKEMAGTIMKAISKCGSPSPRSARDMIGEVGWEVVVRMGGWNSLCASVTHENETSYMAQMRELCLVGVKREQGYKTKSEWSAERDMLLEASAKSIPALLEPMNDFDFIRAREEQVRMLMPPEERQTLNFIKKEQLSELEFTQRQKEMLKNLQKDQP